MPQPEQPPTCKSGVCAPIALAFSSSLDSYPLLIRHGKFPIRPINLSDPADKARHDRMVQLVEQMLALQKQLAEARTGHETNSIQRQIDATDRQIDRLVYDLYGLTEEEIAVVEGK